MATTVVHLEADTVEVDEQPRYRLYASCTEPGDLQDVHMFLIEIVDTLIPIDDVFKRVLNVSDLDSEVGFLNDRGAAIAAGSDFYRSNEFTKYYDDVEVAANAKQVAQDEINRYVNEYTTYSTEFVTTGTGEDVSFPTAEESTSDALQTAYDTALTAYNTALATQVVATVTLTDAEEESDEAGLWVEKRDVLASDLDLRTGEIEIARTQYQEFLSAAEGKAKWFHTKVKEFINAYDIAYNPEEGELTVERDTLETEAQQFLEAITTATAADVNGTIQTGVNEHTTMRGSVNTYYIQSPSVDADLQTKQNAVTTAQTAKIIADADVTAKYDLVVDAYQAAKAVSPDWTPVPPLPGLPSSLLPSAYTPQS